MKKFIVIINLLLILILILSGCNNTQTGQISIAEQYGLAYAPIQIMKEKGFLKAYDPDLDVKWKQLGNTVAIREAMLAGNVDIGFMAIPPFLIGRDKGMKWKIINGLNISPLGLVTYKENVDSIDDITVEDRIALPQPGSIQHILLAMACEKRFSNASKFDDILVTMAHPDGMNALLSRKEITAHFTSPPYIFEELAVGNIHQILSGKEAMGGEFTFIIGVGTEKFHDNNPENYQIFVKSLHDAIEFIKQNPEEAAKILANKYEISEEKILKYITWPGMKYTSSIKGVEQFIDFMQKTGYINLKYNDISEISWGEETHDGQ